jgi:hypothetical protein
MQQAGSILEPCKRRVEKDVYFTLFYNWTTSIFVVILPLVAREYGHTSLAFSITFSKSFLLSLQKQTPISSLFPWTSVLRKPTLLR